MPFANAHPLKNYRKQHACRRGFGKTLGKSRVAQDFFQTTRPKLPVGCVFCLPEVVSVHAARTPSPAPGRSLKRKAKATGSGFQKKTGTGAETCRCPGGP